LHNFQIKQSFPTEQLRLQRSMNMKLRSLLTLFVASGLLFTACQKKQKSAVTGQGYNDPKWGGFFNPKYKGQETGPGLVLIEGGSFTMGTTEQDMTADNNSVERKVTVNSFYMDETEVSNVQYREYLYWVNRVFTEYPEVYRNALPDTLCWRSKLAYNEPFVEYYFRHPAYKDYPVVGVNWVQASDFASWRTDRVNEMILDREGIVKFDVTSDGNNDNNFNTRSYLAGQFQFAKKGKHLPRDYTKKKATRERVSVEDGILLPDYRLPTESEWEYAAQANIGNTVANNIDVKKIYPWNDYTVRVKEGKER
jgi:sulfatase modifying factor 1